MNARVAAALVAVLVGVLVLIVGQAALGALIVTAGVAAGAWPQQRPELGLGYFEQRTVEEHHHFHSHVTGVTVAEERVVESPDGTVLTARKIQKYN